MRRLLLAASVVVVAGCGSDKSTGPASGVSGTMSFTYTGGGGGSFNVSGVMPTIQANIGNVDWAAGHLDTPNTMTEIGGARHRNAANRYDLAFVGIHRLTVGTSEVDANCES